MPRSIPATATDTDAKIAAVRLAAHEDICRERYEHIGERFDQVKDRFDQVKDRFDQIDRALARHDREFENVYRRFDKVDRKFEAMQRILVVYGFLIAALVATTFFGVDLATISEIFGIVR